MKRLLYLAMLAMVFSLVIAPAALAQSPAEGDLYDCEDFTYQEEAQAVYDQDTSDPYGLDGPIGESSSGEPGVACEDQLPPQPDTSGEMTDGGNGEDQYTSTDQYGTSTAGEEPTVTEDLPSTGGPAFLIPASILLLGTGLLGLRILRK